MGHPGTRSGCPRGRWDSDPDQDCEDRPALTAHALANGWRDLPWSEPLRYSPSAMADEKPLRVLTAFGPSRDETLLLTVHPDEQYERGGPSPRRRTLVLALSGSTARFIEEWPVPLV